MSKHFKFVASEAAKIGETIRTGDRKISLHEAIESTRKKPGRKPKFEEETGRLNAFIPIRLLEKIQERAWWEKKTVSQLVAELIEKMF
jgi:hypothetical protein